MFLHDKPIKCVIHLPTTAKSKHSVYTESSFCAARMLQNNLLEGSWIWFWAWGQKCFKTAFWKRPGLDFECEARNASKRHSGSVLDMILNMRPEMLQNCFLEASSRWFWAWGQKCFKTAFWKRPGPDFEYEARNASKRPSGSVLDVILSVTPEMLQTGLLEASIPKAGCFLDDKCRRNHRKAYPRRLIVILACF